MYGDYYNAHFTQLYRHCSKRHLSIQCVPNTNTTPDFKKWKENVITDNKYQQDKTIVFYIRQIQKQGITDTNNYIIYQRITSYDVTQLYRSDPQQCGGDGDSSWQLSVQHRTAICNFRLTLVFRSVIWEWFAFPNAACSHKLRFFSQFCSNYVTNSVAAHHHCTSHTELCTAYVKTLNVPVLSHNDIYSLF